MAQVKKGDRVRIHFTGTLEDGTVFDSTLNDDEGDCGCDDCGCEEAGPMELTLGEEEFFLQIEEALIGMSPGEKKSVIIPAEEAFGEYDEEKVFAVERSQFPSDITPEFGQELEFSDDDDETYPVTVVEVDDATVTLDANHPLAGENLTYEFELLEIL
ncbi:MAG TPA: peptidylprolyl isomerase [Deferrimonas sp.]|jgi:peptidylprolyl isomerase